MKDEIKAFPDKQTWRDFITNRPALQEMLKWKLKHTELWEGDDKNQKIATLY